MHILNYTLQAKDTHVKELNSCLLAISKEVALMESCQMYMITNLKDDDSIFQITEIWDDLQSYDNSIINSNRTQFWEQALNFLFHQNSEPTIYTVVGGYFNLGNG